MNMVDHLSGPLAGIASRVGADVSKLDALGQTFGGFIKAGTAMQGAGSQITSAVLAPVEATFETRRALGELASLGVEDLDALESAARNFSDQWSGTTKADFISAAYDIKSGISSLSDEGVAEFTALAALTAKATKSTASEMTSLFATGYGIYKGYYDDLTDIQFGEMFSAGIAESVRAFKTSGTGMAQGIQSLGASATTANVPLEEQLAILGMLQATMGGAEAGTKYKAFLRSAAKGGEALGLSFLDANNQLLSMPEILEQLRGKFGETMDAAEKMELQKAFGDTEAVALIDLLYSKTGDLQDNILNLYDAMGQGTGVAQDMASAIQETEPERFARLQQRIHNVTESIGNSLLPTVNDLMGKGEQVLTKVASWIEENKELVKIIMLIVLAIGGFLTVAGTVIAVVGGVGLVITKAVSAFKILKAGFLLAKGALAPLIGSVWSFTAALLANPVTWIVIGIVALIAALVLLYNKCEWFRNGVNAILGFFKEKLGAALEVARNIFGAIGGVIGRVLGAAKATVQEKLDNMKRAYEEHGGGIRGAAAAAMEGVKGVYTAGYTFLDNLTGGKLSGLKDAAAQRLGELKAVYEENGGGIRGVAAATMEGVRGITEAGFNTLNSLTGGKLDGLKAAYEENGGGIRGAAAATVEGVKGVFGAGYNFLDNLTGGKLTAIKDKFSEKLSPITGTVGSILDAAGATVSEKLGNMRTAYEQHGGGVQGIAAAAMEGVKGYYTAGFTFLDNLTGGKLSEIGGKFTSTMSGIVQGIGQKFTEAGSAFMTGLGNIKNTVTGAVTWFFDSGKKIVSTFANGIRSAFSGAVDAVKGGLQKIRNLLPFSDAKEGPLSTLTLSGQRTMTTYAHGLTLAQDAPADAMEQGLQKAKVALQREPVAKVNIGGDRSSEDTDTAEGDGSSSGGKQVIIQKLIMQVDLKKIKDLQTLLSLLKEVEDYSNGNGDDDPDAVPSPA
ncbi:phage tail tape measure protein [Paramuribaculum intestinale]|jgi:TP901 family phage tail tape measure protein|uniref:phage tail tape measure protein n=3 Tax=Bacteria TaxID=2 RepID=UPI0025B6A032|nr:phage tail tape measure protein [Paramuribaculum intestinale]